MRSEVNSGSSSVSPSTVTVHGSGSVRVRASGGVSSDTYSVLSICRVCGRANGERVARGGRLSYR